MGQITTYVCDKCRKEIESISSVHQWRVVDEHGIGFQSVSFYELCPECSKAFKLLMDNAVEQFEKDKSLGGKI